MPSNSRMNLTALRAARYPGRHAAGTGERAEMIRDSSWREVPRISRDLTSRSRDTEGSPASIFAMRDWLDWRRLARSACVRLRRASRASRRWRSEEHTSELQSRLHLVCRLLLEKKKTIKIR